MSIYKIPKYTKLKAYLQDFLLILIERENELYSRLEKPIGLHRSNIVRKTIKENKRLQSVINQRLRYL